jgi:hypothetical protein
LIVCSLIRCENNKKTLAISHEIDSKIFNKLFVLTIDSFIKTNKMKNCDICIDIYSRYQDIFFYIKCVSPKYNNQIRPLNYIIRRGLKVYLSTPLDELTSNYNDSAHFNRNEYQRTIRCWYVDMKNEAEGLYESKELIPKNYKIQIIDTSGRTIFGIKKVEPIFKFGKIPK